MAGRHTRKKRTLLTPVKNCVRMTSAFLLRGISRADKVVRDGLCYVERAGDSVVRTTSKAVKSITGRKGTRRHRK